MADGPDTTTTSAGQAVLTINDLNTTVNHEPRIEDVRLAKSLGFERPWDIRKLIERHREALQRLGEVVSTVEKTSAEPFSATVALNGFPKRRGRPGRPFWLNKRQCLYLCTKSETANATEATIQMVEVFDAYLAGALAKSVYVRPHKRARPKLPRRAAVAIPASPSVDRDGFAVMRLAGEILVVNLMDLAPTPGARAVVIGWDKKILVEDMSEARSNRSCLGDRNFILPNPKDKKFPRSVYAVGMVVASQPAISPRKVAKAKPKTRPVGAPRKHTRPLGGADLIQVAALGSA